MKNVCVFCLSSSHRFDVGGFLAIFESKATVDHIGWNQTHTVQMEQISSVLLINGNSFFYFIAVYLVMHIAPVTCFRKDLTLYI